MTQIGWKIFFYGDYPIHDLVIRFRDISSDKEWPFKVENKYLIEETFWEEFEDAYNAGKFKPISKKYISLKGTGTLLSFPYCAVTIETGHIKDLTYAFETNSKVTVDVSTVQEVKKLVQVQALKTAKFESIYA